MKKLDFTEGWLYRRLGLEEEAQPISIPHDAMFYEKRTASSLGGKNTGGFEGFDYQYLKRFFVPNNMENKKILFEFEGVYHNAEIFLNGKKAAFRPYGYSNFYVDTEGFLEYGRENEIQVIARNADQPNSRWYSGAGIYRPVYMYIAENKHIDVNGVKIRTLEIEPAVIEVEVKTIGLGTLNLTILQDEKEIISTKRITKEERTIIRLTIPEARLWSPEDPNLYQCLVKFEEDEVKEVFGIRTLNWSSETGLAINEKRVILRGACIHHDNGLLGACSFPEAEERKVRVLKENGYNAIRSAHNPCSKALLDACDRQGMLLMDEYLDVWYIHKTEYDYADYMQQWWKQDLKDMVEKDYNHPCVILYSTGNEVSETAQKKGIALTGEMTEYLHSLDASRSVTCGINIFFNLLSSIGFGVYSDEKAKKEVEKARNKKENVATKKMKKKVVGSEFYNRLAGMLGDRAMKWGATLYPCDLKTRDAYANMDIAGYNYGILRYKHDLKKYPSRLIIGTETFCKDAYDFWEMAKKYPRIIGDFVWAGMDYMGEAGIGAWEYEDYAPANAPEEGWLTAGSGRINILGRPNGEALYTKVAFEQTKKPVIVVKPVYQTGKHSPSAWKMTDAIESWTYPGCSGMKAEIEVYARAAKVELFINGKLVGSKKLKNTCRTMFRTNYEDGEIVVISKDENGREIARSSLKTAEKETILTLLPEEKQVQIGKITYILIRYTDRNGILKPMEKGKIQVTVKGGILLGLGNACSYNTEGYLSDITATYYGEALAVVRADDANELVVEATDGDRKQTVTIPCMS